MKLKKTRRSFDKSNLTKKQGEVRNEDFDAASAQTVAPVLAQTICDGLPEEDILRISEALITHCNSWEKKEKSAKKWFQEHIELVLGQQGVQLVLSELGQSEENNRAAVELPERPPAYENETRNSSIHNKIKALFSGEGKMNQELTALFIQNLEENNTDSEIIALAEVTSKHWDNIQRKKRAYDGQFTAIQDIHQALASFLDDIRNIQNPFRKPLLSWVARWCNTGLEQYEFVSPEHFAKVDPNYHNVVESNGSRIKCGLSFLLIRKENRQVLIKADVITY